MLRNFLIERVMCYTLTSEEKCKFKGGGGVITTKKLVLQFPIPILSLYLPKKV